MGSEHYCLRWNNHQSNLLGVFSQLLQDESLVDVTLACSEGASIRAHKVVLSACSSYFQSLFLDHPEKHPIVILKDVRFSELQTLVDFMYKGEVNVQYCQLSALLKTAESLKVKGLAEMTNQSAALREPEREPDRLRPHSQPTTISSKSCDPPTLMDTTTHHSSTITSGFSTNNNSNNNNINQQNTLQQQQQQQQLSSNNLSTLLLKRESDRCSPSPPKRLHRSSPLPLDLYQRRCPSNNSCRRENLEHESTGGSARTSTPTRRAPSAHTNNSDDQSSPRAVEDSLIHQAAKSSNDDNDDDERSKNDVVVNMTMNPSSSAMGLATGSNISGSSGPPLLQTVVVPPNNLSSSSLLHSTERPPSRSGLGGGNSVSNISGISGSQLTHTATSSDINSPNRSSEPVAGPSGLGPVQSVPLSLKKEIDWDRNDDKSTCETTLDYRHSHDSETSESPHGLGGGNSGTLEQSGPSVYQCVYCGATFPHQSKLTRHILSHSLETLKFREMGLLHSTAHLGNLMPHELPPLPQHFPHRHISPGQLIEPMEPPDNNNPMDIDFTSALAASTLGSTILLGSSVASGGNSTVSISTSGASSSSAAAAAAAAAAAGSSSGNDPNSVVLCKFCGKNFPDVASLITHLPAHTGDRPFKCEFCGKAFKLRHHMKDHCRVHTGERPFRCNMCGKTFSRSTILKAHEKTHFPKYVRKFLSPSPVDTKDELPQ